MGSEKWALENLWSGAVEWCACVVTTLHGLLCPSSAGRPLISCLGWWNRTYNPLTCGAKMDFWAIKKNMEEGRFAVGCWAISSVAETQDLVLFTAFYQEG